ncbi:MAG: stage II sporulation protein R, partial [Oscillibacter sp.]|nr:stage II sporulation protein R [Oscillibacter sp.]
MKKLYPIEITLLLTVALLLASGASALHTQEELSEKVVRLHVLANSDSEEDQALKLLVRDAVLETTTKRLAGVADRGEAAQRLYE